LAAIFSDWCEYPPLYTLLNTWLSGSIIKSRIIAGRGDSAVPYIHVHDAVQFFLRVIGRNDKLPKLRIFNASPDGATSHLELFNISTQYYFGKNIKPICVSRQLLGPMILLQQLLSRLQGKRPFEQLWMLSYVDKQLAVDSSRTRKELSWQPTPRKSISRRLLFLIENMKKHPEIWLSWNEAMLRKGPQRPYLVIYQMIYDAMVESRDSMVKEIEENLLDPEKPTCSCSLMTVDDAIVNTYIKLLYQLIVTVIRTRDRPMMQQYAITIAFLPSVGGFGNRISSHCMFVIGNFIGEKLRARPEFRQRKPGVDDYITMTIHQAIDQIEDQYELLTFQSSNLLDDLGKRPPENDKDIEEIISQLENLCQEAISGKSWTSPLTKSQFTGDLE